MELAITAVEEKKALTPVVLDLRGISEITDYFLICSGQTPIQVRAIADNLLDKMKEAGVVTPQKEGYHDGRWILLDFGNLIIHIMHQADRDFYALEHLWHQAKILN